MNTIGALFYLFSAVLLFASFRVITARSTVHAALYLVLAFANAAVIWMLLKAEFLAIALVLVYVGAVMVLFLFVVMMLDLNSSSVRDGFWKHFPLAGIIGAVIALEMALVLMGGFRVSEPAALDPAIAKMSNTQALGYAIYTQYLYRADAAQAQGHQGPGPVPAGAGEEGGPPAHRQDGADRRSAFGRCRRRCHRHPGRRQEAMNLGPITLGHYLSLGGLLFALSVIGIYLNRRNLIVLLMAIELMLLAVNLNFVAFSHYLGDMAGQVFVFFILTVAAAESAIGLAILVVLFRNRATINVEELDSLKG
jgi:NADH-quinone oxidoreductase subunit J